MKKIVSLLFVVVMLFAVCEYAFAETQMYSLSREKYDIEVPDFLSVIKGIVSTEDNCEITDGEAIWYYYADGTESELNAYDNFLREEGFVLKSPVEENDGTEPTLYFSKGKALVNTWIDWENEQGVGIIVFPDDGSLVLTDVPDQHAVLRATQGSWLDTCGDLIALDYPEYLESLKDESGFLFGRSTYHLGITKKNSRIIAETGLGYFEDGYGPVIKGLQLGKDLSINNLTIFLSCQKILLLVLKKKYLSHRENYQVISRQFLSSRRERNLKL